MKLDYVTVPDNLSGFGYYFIKCLTFIFNLFLIISNNYIILFTCLLIPICIYFNKLNKDICIFMVIIFIGRILTYENQHYDDNKNVKVGE